MSPKILPILYFAGFIFAFSGSNQISHDKTSKNKSGEDFQSKTEITPKTKMSTDAGILHHDSYVGGNKTAKRSNNGYPLKVQVGVRTRTNDPTLSLLTVQDRNAYILSPHTTLVSF